MSSQESTAGLIVLAVDDEEHGLAELKYLLEQNPKVRRVLTAFDAAEALRVVRGNDPELAHRARAGLPPVDAVFVDIDMPGLSGMELGKVFTAFRNPPSVVFVTGYPGEAVDAFELGATDYIVKPARPERVNKAVERVEKNLRRALAQQAEAAQPEQRDDEVIPVELAGTTKLVPRSSVRYVEAQGDYARLYTNDGSHLVRVPLAQLEERWADAGFIRIHRSYLVALPLVTELRMSSSGYTVVLGTGAEAKELPVSRRHTRDLKDRLVRAPKQGWNSGG